MIKKKYPRRPLGRMIHYSIGINQLELFCFIVEGKAAAEAYLCKYAEVSAVLMHHVDELLVGILKQIRLIEQQKEKHHGKCRPAFGQGDDTCCLATKQGLIGRLLGSYQSKSCDNLLVL